MKISLFPVSSILAFCFFYSGSLGVLEYLTILYLDLFHDTLSFTTPFITVSIVYLAGWAMLINGLFFFTVLFAIFSLWTLFFCWSVFLLFLLPAIMFFYNNVYIWWNIEWFDFFVEHTITLTTLISLYQGIFGGGLVVIFFILSFSGFSRRTCCFLLSIPIVLWLLSGMLTFHFFINCYLTTGYCTLCFLLIYRLKIRFFSHPLMV